MVRKAAWLRLWIDDILMLFITVREIDGSHTISRLFTDSRLVQATYTTTIVSLYIYEGISSSIDMEHLSTDEEIWYGRQLGVINILAETALQTTLWGNKCCLLIFYHRLS
jgi:hypothetical protein